MQKRELPVILSLSGGLDSTCLLASLRADGYFNIHPVSFKYPSKHNKYELDAAKNVAAFYGLRHRIINVSDLFRSFRSALLKDGGEIPEGHYTDESMAATVVPARNMIFASVLAGLAQSIGEQKAAIALAVHAGDHAIYPDCRPPFVQKMNSAISEATEWTVELLAPFLFLSKGELLRAGLSVGKGINPETPVHLTRTCYKDQPIACGKCGACVERLEAFADLGIQDPIAYEKE